MNKDLYCLKMKVNVIIILLSWLQKSTAETHSMTLQIIGSKGGDLPDFMESWMVDDVPIYRYNSSVGMETMVPAPDWLNNLEGHALWQEICDITELDKTLMSDAFKLACQHANVTGTEKSGTPQIYQAHGQCALNSDGTIEASLTHAFNGHDYVHFDVRTQTWTAAVSSAFFYKTRREADHKDLVRLTHLYGYQCVKMLQTILKYIPWIKERKVPQVHLIEKHALTSSEIEVTCHVTGFYPRDIRVEWLVAGGLPLEEGVRSGVVLPNGDGTYQLRMSLTVSEEAQGTQSYSCLVIHSSVSENITVTWVPESDSGVGKVIAIVAVLGLILILAVIFCIIKNRRDSVV
ncbi:hypothetical protein AGOR_G00121270 [Albula goreensis]|uniref:Ig-like domain-containing protein n=1 Tax=Albula goreensis TaxID=1534307 RepID=A0A8T3DAT5_9TELE|nr:hypothetical protein AGOR_G00121270 [Albula goreensis]